MDSITSSQYSSIRYIRKKARHMGVPKFLRFLYQILQVEDQEIINWTKNGQAFQIQDITKLEKTILPKYFKHKKLSSFQRQLNYFGFRKWTKTQTSICTFSHPYFLRNCPENLQIITKKSAMNYVSRSSQSNMSEDRNLLGKRPVPDLVNPIEFLKKQKRSTIDGIQYYSNYSQGAIPEAKKAVTYSPLARWNNVFLEKEFEEECIGILVNSGAVACF